MIGLVVLTVLSVHAPQTSGIRHDEEVQFFPVLGWRAADGSGWEFDVHGVIYKPEHQWVVALLRGALKERLTEAGADIARFKRCAQPFFNDTRRGRKIRIQVSDATYKAGTSQAGGHFTARIQIPNKLVEDARRIARDRHDRAVDSAHALIPAPHTQPAELRRAGAEPRVIRFSAVTRPDDPRVFEGEVFLVEATGLSVVSDIDDTIRLTGVGDNREVFRTTFCQPFRAVPGMAALYRAWRDERGAEFHYLSASPWQLYAPLADFVRDEGFPAGSFHLRAFRLKDTNIFGPIPASEPHKRVELEALLGRFPHRRFVLIGDSTERDPEVYAAFARRYPRQVIQILIRNVTDSTADSERYRKAFEGLPRELWKVFRDPAEIRNAIPADETVGRGAAP